MAKLEGSLWVNGDNLHYVDHNGHEWRLTGWVSRPNPGGVAGSIWVEGHYLAWVSENGANICAFQTDPIAAPWVLGVTGPAAIEGSIYHYAGFFTYVGAPPSHTWASHWDVAHSNTHGDAHTNTGAHTDTPHSNTHTNTHGDIAHVNTAHVDHNDHNDTAHGNTHTDSHGNVAHQDQHGDYGTHYDAIYFLNDPPPGHSDTQYHGDTPDNYHTNVAHTDTHGDVAHKDTPHTNHQDHDNVAAVNTHTNTHGDVPHSDIAHGDTGTHNDVHTNTHSDVAHKDQPTWIGP
jgi:hypothetical protein